MLRSTTAYGLFILLILAVRTPVQAAEPPVENWLRGSGKDLEMRLHGEVLNADGKPASGFKLDVLQAGRVFETSLKPTVDGNRFTIWIPVNRQEWYTVQLRAVSRDEGALACRSIGAFQLRQTAIDGINLTLEPARKLQVQVVGQGAPVSGAHVKAEVVAGGNFQSISNSDGIATLAIPSGLQLSYLTAWTDDHRIGGYYFRLPPTRDVDANEHIVELVKQREERLRFVAEDGTPISGLSVLLKVSTGRPHRNFIAANDYFRVTSDANGEVLYPWYPDWKDSSSYTENNEEKWLPTLNSKVVDGVRVFTYARRASRKEITGRVTANNLDTTAGGFLVRLRGWPTERYNHSHLANVFTNADGTFAAEVLPDAQYSGAVADSRWAGKFANGVPYESAGDKVTPLVLEAVEGQPVEVTVTSGDAKRPVQNALVQFRQDRRSSFTRDGKELNGYGSAQWSELTDKHGIVTTRALPGGLEVSINTPTWQPSEELTISKDARTKIALHREVDKPRPVTGQLTVAPEVAGTDVGAVEIMIASLDSKNDDARTIKPDASGNFSFETFSPAVALLARTPDGKAAGWATAEQTNSPLGIEIALQPTAEYHGQLLLKDDSPAVGYLVYGVIRVERSKTADLVQLETTTDAEGKFSFSELPASLTLNILATPNVSTHLMRSVKSVRFEPGEKRAGLPSYFEHPLAR